METAQKLKITYIEVEERESYHGTCLRVLVRFTCSDLSSFGILRKNSKAMVIPDIAALEKHYAETPAPDFDKELVPCEDHPNSLKWEPLHPSAYDLDLIKMMDIDGCDKIRSQRRTDEEENNYSFEEFVADCAITRACIKQLGEMKEQIDQGICTFGDFPDQAGCFRSGDVASDFAGILQSLDRFWD